MGIPPIPISIVVDGAATEVSLVLISGMLVLLVIADGIEAGLHRGRLCGWTHA